MAHRGPEKGKGRRGKHEKHTHHYVPKNQVAKVVEGKTVIYTFYVCDSRKGTCDQKDKMEITRP